MNHPKSVRSAKLERNVLKDFSEIDDLDKKLLNILQKEFPLSRKPFDLIGEQIGLNGSEVLTRVDRLVKDGFIRRIGPVLERKSMGYAAVLCGVRVKDDLLETFSQEVNALAGVTHNYEREGDLNVWFTIIQKDMKQIEHALGALEDKFNVKIYRFPEKRTFKIRTFFRV